MNFLEVQNQYSNFKLLFVQYHEIQLRIAGIDISEINNEEISEFENSYYSIIIQSEPVIMSKETNSSMKSDIDLQNASSATCFSKASQHVRNNFKGKRKRYYSSKDIDKFSKVSLDPFCEENLTVHVISDYS
ncbi:hypothetical protein Trydic_g10909 [Trypoxylus dichotomus]